MIKQKLVCCVVNIIEQRYTTFTRYCNLEYIDRLIYWLETELHFAMAINYQSKYLRYISLIEMESKEEPELQV